MTQCRPTCSGRAMSKSKRKKVVGRHRALAGGNPVDSAGFGGLSVLAGNAKSLKAMPRGGIEPPTRGFSDLKPTWPSPRIRSRNSVAREETVAHLSHEPAADEPLPLLPALPRTTPRP